MNLVGRDGRVHSAPIHLVAPPPVSTPGEGQATAYIDALAEKISPYSHAGNNFELARAAVAAELGLTLTRNELNEIARQVADRVVLILGWPR